MASGNAAAALVAAMRLPGVAKALVSCGGLPDRAGSITLARLATPTLLVVGEHDSAAVESNRAALRRLPDDAHLEVVTGATHAFEEAGALEQVVRVVVQWFRHHLDGPRQPVRTTAGTGSARTLH